MAEGRSNAAIAAALFVTEKAIGKHTNSIFGKLGLPQSEDANRRVLAVLAYLNPDRPALPDGAAPPCPVVRTAARTAGTTVTADRPPGGLRTACDTPGRA